MKKLTVVAAAAILSSGCSALLYPHPHAPFSHRPQVRAEATPPVGRWDLVMRLPRDAVVDVLTRDGTAHVGAFAGSNETSLVLRIDGQDRRIARADVIRVDLMELPGSDAGAVAKGLAGGALLGAGAAGLVAAVIGGEAWPPPGLLLRGGAVIGGVSGAERAILQRRGRLIYLAPHP